MFNQAEVGTQYVVAAIRVLVNSNDPADVQKGSQSRRRDQSRAAWRPATFEESERDSANHKRVRDGCWCLRRPVPDRASDVHNGPTRAVIGARSAAGTGRLAEATSWPGDRAVWLPEEGE